MPSRPPKVTLGHLAPNGVAPSLCGLVELGARKRPSLARQLEGVVEIRFRENFAAVRIEFGDKGVLVEDAEGRREAPDVIISGSMTDISQVAAAPLSGGLPRITHPRGRQAIKAVAGGRVKIEGRRALARKLMRLLEL
jgi:hypothetical protein